jgi:hypothetical protein
MPLVERDVGAGFAAGVRGRQERREARRAGREARREGRRTARELRREAR